MRRLAQFVRLRASRVSRLSVCVCVRLRRSSCACVSRLASVVLSRVCVRLSRVRLASVCVCSRQGFRMRASASCASVVLSRVGRLVSHLSRVGLRLSRVCVSRLSVCPCECLRELAHFMRRSSFKRFFAIVILSYNVPMPKYPSHHLIYVFYHPMPIMPLY